ncbi:MAG: protein-L-isoaspartate(D-aspartate) O-methyltransferase [Alphaproteobacteria bacterium]|nr:protein-L-isoaspartate(D-aspartate) O-methyltransferase [Alphaproteobacteria bacterium]
MAVIEAEMSATAWQTGRDALSPAVAEALLWVPRHLFVPPTMRALAYENRPLPIGGGQTISQPFVVALMTELLDLEPGCAVLEIGTGSGYQAAVLGRLAGRVETVELRPDLAAEAAARLTALGAANVHVHQGDGKLGWPPGAPYDRILLTAAAEPLPRPLFEQLAPQGRLVAPLGPPGTVEWLVTIDKDSAGKLSTRRLLPVAFVPLV